MSEWWVGRQGANPVGPVSTDTLVRGIVEKKVPEDALVCRVGEKEWQHIPQVEEIWELVHPEQDEHTNITNRPWFADKQEEAIPEWPDVDADDESTRVLAVPILPMRTISVESHPSQPDAAKPAAVAPRASVGAPRPQSQSSNGTPAAAARSQPAHAPTAAAPKGGLQPAPGFNAPGAAHAAAANPAKPAEKAAPRNVVAPPRFGTERVSARPAPAVAPSPSAPQPIGSSSPSASGVAQRSAAATAVHPKVADSEPPDSGDRPSVPLIPVRPNLAAPQSTAKAVPLQASRPAASSTPQVRPPLPSEPKPAAAILPAGAPPPPPPVDPTPIIVGHPRGAVDYEDDTVTVIAKVPAGMPPPPPAVAPPPPQTAPREHTPIMPFVVQRQPAPAPQAGPPPPPPPEPPPAPSVTARFSSTTTQPSAVARPHAGATPSVPPSSGPAQPEVEPSDLFDEDFEPPPAPPVTNAAPAQGSSVRPAAGTPAPPSVIVTHRPPSMHDELLSHAIPHLPEETRPALRSLRAPGMIQVSIGALIIGALAIIVVMLSVVLLLR